MSLATGLSTKQRPQRESNLLDWDRLWYASGSALPLHRAHCLARYLDAFEGPSEFSAVNVRRNNKTRCRFAVGSDSNCSSIQGYELAR